MITTNAHEISLERGRLWIVLVTIVINIVAVSLLTFAPWSDWRTGAALNIVDNCLFVAFDLVRRGTSFLASSELRSHSRCSREPCDGVRGARLLWPESVVDYRSFFATPSRFGLLIDWVGNGNSAFSQQAPAFPLR